MPNGVNFPTANFAKWRADSEGFVNAGEVDRFNYSLDLWANEVERWASEFDTSWRPITLASTNWTITRATEWRNTGGRIELRGSATRGGAAFPPVSNIFALGGTNPPVPQRLYAIGGFASIAAAAPTSQYFTWVVDPSAGSTGTLRSGATTYTVAVGDVVALDGLWWPSD